MGGLKPSEIPSPERPKESVVLRIVARGQTSDKKVDLPSRWDLTGVRPLAPARWAYSYPRVIHRSEESPQELLPAASVNNSAAEKFLGMKIRSIFLERENTHRPATNIWARRTTSNNSPSRQAVRWSPTNTQWRTASISRSHYKPFDGTSQRVFLNNL
jgi:hypothetical protein